MIALTAKGFFASELIKQKQAEVISIRELGEKDFWQRIRVVNTLIHNAASIDCRDVDTCLLKNFEFSKIIIDFLSANNPEINFTYISSMSILDPNSEKNYLFPEKMTPYAFSKFKAEQYCLASNIANLKVVRFSTVFYKDPAKDGLSKLIYDAVTKQEITIYNGGEAVRDFIPLNVAASYVGKVVEFHSTKKEIFNIVSGVQTSFKDIALYLKKIIPNLNIINVTKTDQSVVLSRFSTESIKQLGEIKFNLVEEVEKYVNEIRFYENSYL